jgi:hypothetical protein
MRPSENLICKTGGQPDTDVTASPVTSVRKASLTVENVERDPISNEKADVTPGNNNENEMA